MDDEQPRAYRPAEFCRRYGVGLTHFFALQKAGQLRTVKSGRMTLVRREDAEAWLASLQSTRAAA
jgi:excisionase family DNA binding protein